MTSRRAIEAPEVSCSPPIRLDMGEPAVTVASKRARVRRSLGRVFGLDLVLLHAPSVWDFRDEVIIQGPLADMIPSTTEFEMYPVGLTSIASYLEANNYNTRLVNLAYRMLKEPGYDVARRIATLKAPVFGIDLHWLPHANGALGIAELVKRIHPDTKVLLGGLSASYFHEELMTNPAVDFVLRGDSTEEPCRQLLQALREGTPLDEVENLAWRREDGTVVVNPLTFVPADLDWIDVPAYAFMLHAVSSTAASATSCPTWSGSVTRRRCCSTRVAAPSTAPFAADHAAPTRSWSVADKRRCARRRSWSPTPA